MEGYSPETQEELCGTDSEEGGGDSYSPAWGVRAVFWVGGAVPGCLLINLESKGHIEPLCSGRLGAWGLCWGRVIALAGVWWVGGWVGGRGVQPGL